MSISVNPENIKALAVDLDGTLLAPGPVLTERTKRAVQACMQRGLRVIIGTGRAINAAEPFRAALGIEGPMICFNGALVVDMPEKTLHITALLDKEIVDFCVDLSREKGIYYQVYFPGSSSDPRIRLVAEMDRAEREMYHKHTGILAEIGDIKETLRRPDISGCVKTMFLAEPEVQAAIRPILDERFGKSAYIAQTYRTFLELMNAKVSKGAGLRFALEGLSLKAGEVIAFGDEENDIPMFEAAGFSVAPANAKESVKSAADIVVGSNAEDGVAVFLEELFGL